MSFASVVVFLVIIAILSAAGIKILLDRRAFRRHTGISAGPGMCAGCPLAKSCCPGTIECNKGELS